MNVNQPNHTLQKIFQSEVNSEGKNFNRESGEATSFLPSPQKSAASLMPQEQTDQTMENDQEKHPKILTHVTPVVAIPTRIELIRRISNGYLFESPPVTPEEIEEIEGLSFSALLSIFFSNYKTLWTLYYIVFILIVGIFISVASNLPYVDGLFMAASSMCGAGLATVSMLSLSKGTFFLIAFQMFIGNPIFMLILTTSIRKFSFHRLRDRLVRSFRDREARDGLKLSSSDKDVISYYENLNHTLGVLIGVFVVYYLLWLVVGTLALYGALFIKPLAPELAGRGMNRFAEASFTTLSALSNTGLTLTSDSLVGWNDNPLAYVIVTLSIIAGNTGLPIFLRFFVKVLVKLEGWMQWWLPERIRDRNVHRYKKSLLFILNNPRKLTTHIFDQVQTIYLIIMVLLFVTIQYVFFLASTLNRQVALESYTVHELVGIGYFQTLSTRTAGFAMMDLRLLSDGLLLIYIIMMYLSAFPLVTTMHGSEVHDAEVNQLKSQDVQEYLNYEYLQSTNDRVDSVPSEIETVVANRLPSNSSRHSASSSEVSQLSKVRRSSLETIAIKRLAALAASEGQSPTNHGNDMLPPLLEGDETLAEDKLAVSPQEIDRFSDGIVVSRQSSASLPPPADGIKAIKTRRSFMIGMPSGALSATPSIADISVKRGGSDGSGGGEDEGDVLTELGIDINSNATDCSDRASAHSSLRDEDSVDQDAFSKMNKSFASQFLLRHSFFIILAVVILSYSENHLLEHRPEADVNMFYVFFEVISAYGCVGLSVGIEGYAYSLSGAMTTLGKLVLVAIMILGKHRGLPSSTDEVIDFTFPEYEKAWHFEDLSISSKIRRRASESRRSSRTRTSKTNFQLPNFQE